MIRHRHRPPINEDDPRYRQLSMLHASLIVMACYLLVIGVLNLALFADPFTAALDLGGAALILLLYAYVRRSADIVVGSWAAVLVLIVVLSGFIAVGRGGNYSLLWVTILPPIAFFLLGLRAGSWLTGLFFATLLGFMLMTASEWEIGPFGLGAFLNFVEVLTAQWFIFRHYEKSRAEAYQRLKKSTSLDALTGLWNRARIDELLADALPMAQRLGRPVALILLDVDYFKRVNDEYGHLVGDAVLTQLAAVFRDNVRQTDQVGRWGGEEFLVICPDTEVAGARTLAEKIREAVAANVFTHNLRITISLGVASTTQAVPVQRLVQAADQELYRAKSQGRNQVCARLEPVT